MFSNHLEISSAGAGNLVGVAVSACPVHGEAAAGNQFLERSAFAIQRNVGALGLANLKKAAAHAGQADRLSRGGVGVRRWQALEIVVVDSE